PQALAVYAACVAAGVIFLPLNSGYTAAEIDYFIENSGAEMMLCDGAAYETLTPLAAKYRAELLVLNADGSGRFCERADDQPDRFDIYPRTADDLAAFLYTSGTTGRSKGAMLSQNNLLSNAQTLADYWHFSKSDVLLHALPIFHTHGLFVATNICLLTGCAMRFYPSFDRSTLIRDMPSSTALMGVPTFYTRLLDDPQFDQSATRNMRLFISGSAPLLAETHKQFAQRTGHRILERYGMTETNMITSNPYCGERRAGTVGHPLPGIEVKITDPETGQPLPLGGIGIIEVRGPNVFKGYWKMPEKTAAELRADGFFITGDLGQVDQDGYFQIVGRDKDLIISGGFNIYPKEIEAALDDLSGVLETAVIGVPHPDFGETVVAVVVAEPDADINPNNLANEMQEKLAKFKQPRSYQIVPQLPRNTMGKVQKAQLRTQYQALFQPTTTD
ncbi:MAG: AMP-binding protein, partial [Paracoccaceae bacterium]|nr:AMP-binding protein [Paracoccaceae bacterium]